MEARKIITLLDKSCAYALKARWASHKRMPSRERASQALKELQRKLAYFQKPNYDCEYTLSAYVLIYQLNHIHMAWRALSSLKTMGNLGTNPRDLLRIVDFGAGTSAGRIGTALMIAEAIKNGLSIDRIYFDEIDISVPMLEMGEFIWRSFVERVHSESDDPALAYAVDIIDSRQHTGWETIRERHDCETWLTAFHVIYQDQDKNNLKRVINRLYGRVIPTAGAFSCYHSIDKTDGDRNLLLMKSVFPPFEVQSSCPAHPSSAKCPTTHISDWALDCGFITEGEHYRGWRPYLHVKDCTLQYGYNIPF